MRFWVLFTVGCLLGSCAIVGTKYAADKTAHYREAYLECAERCEGYAPIVSPFTTAQGVRYCYCNTAQPNPDRLRLNTAQENWDRLVSEPPPNFHI